MAEGLLISFLYLCLRIAVICIVAYAIVWIMRVIGLAIDPMVYKIGKIIVVLLILIAVVLWLFGIQGTGLARLS